MKTVGFDNTSSERSRVARRSRAAWVTISECCQSGTSITRAVKGHVSLSCRSKAKHLKTQDFLRLANPYCKSNFKKKPALCEQQLLLAANKDKEWGMFERWIILLLLFREQRVTPFPYLLR